MFAALRQRRLVERAQQGDGAAFASLIEPELAAMYRVAYYLARDVDEAKELVQLTSIRAYEALGKFRPEAKLGPWLQRILRNLFIDRRRSAASRHEILSDDPELRDASEMPASASAGDLSPLAQLLAAEQRADLTEHIRALPESFREVLVLCDIQGLSYNEVAELTELPLGTIKSRLSRARLLLRDRLTAAREPAAARPRKHRGGVS